jgi:hypothetical protein
MAILLAVLGTSLISAALWDAFETVVLPRRVTRKFRLTRLFYRCSWFLWKKITGVIFSRRIQETCLSFYGPISLLFLFSLWAASLITGFALLFRASGLVLSTTGRSAHFFVDLYLSCTTFFTLGLGDVTPGSTLTRVYTAIEAGLGFGFLALVIGYLPMLTQSFSRREVNISLLDARAGSPPTAAEMLRRHGHDNGLEELRALLHEWERWTAELLESHLSYPVLAYFRSQHDNQSWLGSIAVILDTCALIMTAVEGACRRQAELTFAMARHSIVDLCQIFHLKPHEPTHNRLPSDKLAILRSSLAEAGLKLRSGSDGDQTLADLRHMYEPHINALSTYLRISIPPWIFLNPHKDNWQNSAWDRRSAASRRLISKADQLDEHF